MLHPFNSKSVKFKIKRLENECIFNKEAAAHLWRKLKLSRRMLGG